MLPAAPGGTEGALRPPGLSLFARSNRSPAHPDPGRPSRRWLWLVKQWAAGGEQGGGTDTDTEVLVKIGGPWE